MRACVNSKDIEVKTIGSKPGEKLYEELMNEEEIRRAWELKQYFVVLPAYGSIYRKTDYRYANVVSKTVSKPYNSGNHPLLSRKDLSDFLHIHDLLGESR